MVEVKGVSQPHNDSLAHTDDTDDTDHAVALQTLLCAADATVAHIAEAYSAFLASVAPTPTLHSAIAAMLLDDDEHVLPRNVTWLIAHVVDTAASTSNMLTALLTLALANDVYVDVVLSEWVISLHRGEVTMNVSVACGIIWAMRGVLRAVGGGAARRQQLLDLVWTLLPGIQPHFASKAFSLASMGSGLGYLHRDTLLWFQCHGANLVDALNALILTAGEMLPEQRWRMVRRVLCMGADPTIKRSNGVVRLIATMRQALELVIEHAAPDAPVSKSIAALEADIEHLRGILHSEKYTLDDTSDILRAPESRLHELVLRRAF